MKEDTIPETIEQIEDLELDARSSASTSRSATTSSIRITAPVRS